VSQNCRYSAVPVARSSSATAAGAEYAIINTTKPFHTFQFDKGAERDTPKNRMLRFGDSVSEKHGEIFGVLDRIFDIPAVDFICRSRQGITLREQRCFECRVRSDLSIPVIHLTWMISLVTITVGED